MRKTIKKALVFSGLTLSVLLLNACGNKGTGKGSVTEFLGENAYGWNVPKDTIEIEYFAGQDSIANVEKYTKRMREFLLENFNVDLNKIVYETDVDERLNLMLASNDYPECLIMSKSQAEKWIERGKVLDLSELVDEYGPDLKERYGKYLDRYRNEEGNLYYLGYGWGLTRWADSAPQLRWDHYLAEGSPVFKNPYDFYDVLKGLVDKNPVNDLGEETYAFGIYKDSSTTITSSFQQTMLGMWGLKNGWLIDQNNNFEHWTRTEQGREMTLLVNQLYRDGYIDPDSFTMSFETWAEKLLAQRYEGHIGGWWQTVSYAADKWVTMFDNYDPNMRYVHVDVVADGVEHSTMNPKSTMGYGVVVLTDKCDNPEDYIRWFNFENTDIGTKLVGWGMPNTEYSAWNFNEETGEYGYNEEFKQQLIDGTIDVYAGFQEIGGQITYMITAGNEQMEDGSYIWIDQSITDVWRELKDENLKDSIYDFTAYYSIVTSPDNPVVDIRLRCSDIVSTAWANAVIASTPEECMAIYDKMVSDCEKAGFTEYIEYMQESYKANLEIYK